MGRFVLSPSPLHLSVLPQHGRNSHIVRRDSRHALCGADVYDGVRFQFEPGFDFGESKSDCQTCARLLPEAQARA